MTKDPYYVTALRSEVEKLWGGHHQFGEPEQIAEMCGYRMLSSFYDDGFTELANRRELLYHRLAAFYNVGDDDILPRIRGILPTDSILPKIVGTLATAYAEPPTRKWKQPGTTTEAPESQVLRSVYERDALDGRLQAALAKAWLMSGCLVGVYTGARGRTQLEILPPDMVRFETAAGFPDRLTKVWLPMLRRTDADGLPLDEPLRVYQVWTDTEVWYENAAGESDDETFMWEPARDDEGKPIIGEDGVAEQVAVLRKPNPYGRIPYVVMRLVEPDSYDTFSGGLAWAADAMCAINGLELNAELSTHFEAHGHWVAVNLELTKQPTRPRFGIGGMTAVDGIMVDDKVPPNLYNVGQNGQYLGIAEYKRKRLDELQRAAGVPESEITRSGTYPSGVARYIERKPLLEQRRKDARNLRFFEQELSELLIRVRNVDLNESIPEGLELEVTFADEDLILEPKDALEIAQLRAAAGAISPSRFIQEMSGQIVASDAEAVQLLGRNRAQFAGIGTGGAAETDGGGEPTEAAPPSSNDAAAELRASVGGSAQIAERQAEFYEGKVPREAVIANLVHVLGFTRAEAEALLPEVLPTPLTAIASTNLDVAPEGGPNPETQT